jgi:uncharacterized protein YecE (DUF72 family)
VKIHVGTSGYGHKEWKGVFYPAGIAAKEMLRFYAERLGAVEINYTYYHLPTESVLAAWAEQVPADFSFALKASRIITHRKRLRKVAEETGYLFRALAALGPKLGPVLFQLPASFPANRAALADFLPLIPAGRLCAFEFRHPSWLVPEILELLRDKGCSLCLADTDENPVGELVNTTDWGYLRLRRAAYPPAKLAGWLTKIRAQPWRRAFVFFKHEEEGREAQGPELAMRFQQLAGAR